MRRPTYEVDDTTFPAEAYTVAGRSNRGIAWRVFGWELEPDVQPESYDDETDTVSPEYWDGESMRRTGRVVCVMVGDDHRYMFEPSELTALDDLAYCGVCGQVGCSHDGRDRSDND